MIGLIQRVSRAEVHVAGERIAGIGTGLLLLLGVERNDGEREVQRLCEWVLDYRVFPDAAGRMNLGLRETDGGILVVSQFTLAADTRKGRRPGFSTAAEPALAKHLYDYCVTWLEKQHPIVASGRFGADMQVSLVNDGPVTFHLQVSPAS